MYTHVLFDLDGTLADTLPLIEYAYDALFSAHPGLGRAGADAMKLLGLPLNDLLAELAPGANVPKLAEEYMRYYRSRHDELLRGYPGVLETLSSLVKEGIVVGVVTSKVRETTERALRELGLLDFMDTIVTAEDVECHKPLPDPILAAMKNLGCEPGATLYVGDSPFDVRAARAAGVAAAAVTWGAFADQDLAAEFPQYVVREPSELLSIVRGIQPRDCRCLRPTCII